MVEIKTILKDRTTGIIASAGDKVELMIEDGSRVCGAIYDFDDNAVVLECDWLAEYIRIYYENIESFILVG